VSKCFLNRCACPTLIPGLSVGIHPRREEVYTGTRTRNTGKAYGLRYNTSKLSIIFSSEDDQVPDMHLWNTHKISTHDPLWASSTRDYFHVIFVLSLITSPPIQNLRRASGNSRPCTDPSWPMTAPFSIKATSSRGMAAQVPFKV